MPTLTIDGRELTVEPGTTVIQAAEELGIYIPRYCWHPGLSIAGNCRICQVEVVKPKLKFPCTIACNLMCGEGMVIETDSAEAKKARADVMEFLLINHPLDCPICDQAGECSLQEFSYEYGHDKSRFEDEKVHKSKRVEFSDKVTFDGERCILCTRCVRFCSEVVGKEELCLVERGDHQEIAVASGGELTNPYSMNVIDLCPVGALTSSDFRFKSRVWFLKDTPSACTTCARHCAMDIGTRWGKIMRLTPRENQDINRWWMCDEGRLNYHYVNAEDRLGHAYVQQNGKLVRTSVDDAVKIAHELMGKLGGEKLYGLISARLTNEEIFLAKRYLTGVVKTRNIGFLPRIGEGDDFLICADKNPNAAGARLIGVNAADGLAGQIKGGRIKGLVILGDSFDHDGELMAALADLDFLVVMDYRLSETAKQADVILPGVTFAEKEGSITNIDGFVSKLNAALPPPVEARRDLDILAGLLARAGQDVPNSAEGVFRLLAGAVPAFADISYGEIFAASRQVAADAVARAD
jgi:NADH-quinone oxidoreductase subunit G